MVNILICILFTVGVLSCGGSSGSTTSGDDSNNDDSVTVALADAGSSSITAGATGVATHTPFTATFNQSMTSSSITDETFYIVAGAKGQLNSPSFDSSICTTSNKLESSVRCTSENDAATSCTLNSKAFLSGETSYTICLTSSITPAAASSSFAGTAITFTTASAIVNNSSCGDTSIQVFEVIEAIPFDVANVRRISKYRSCIGHSMNDGFEPTPYSSMKHYVYGPTGHANCYYSKVYAPFAGTIVGALADTDVSNDTSHTNAGCSESASSAYIAIQSSAYPRFAVNLEHVNPVTGLETGDMVTAGQEIGYGILPTPENGSWDLVFGTVDISEDLNIHAESGLSLYSYCTIGEFLTSSATGTLSNYGVDNPNELKFTKAEREASPCTGTMGGDGIPEDQMSFDAQFNNDPNQWVALARF